MAGTARMAPAITPLTTSCVTSASNGGIAGSGDFQQYELAGIDLVVAELAIDDVADVGEVARSARAFIVDLLALCQELEPFDRAVDLAAASLRDLAHVVVDGDAGRGLGLGDGKADEARPIGGLGFVGIRLGDAETLSCEVVRR